MPLNDSQMQIVMSAASSLPMEKRDTFLQRVAARLLRGGSPYRSGRSRHWFEIKKIRPRQQ
jgi:hypothetical protein